MKQRLTKYIRPAVILLVLLALTLGMSSVSAFADIVEPSASYYVTDEAGVISAETESYIASMNGQLESSCDGAQIVVVAVDFLDGMDIEDYAYKVFNEWGIGDSSENNGVLLLLTIGEENYWCMQGKGLENSLTAGTIDDILWYNLEPDFASGDYDVGVRTVFDALYNEICSIYGVSGSGSSGSGAAGGYDSDYAGNDYEGSQYIDQVSSAARIMSWISLIITLLIIMFVILFIYTLIKRSAARRRYYPPTYHPTHGPHPGHVRPATRPRTRPIIFYGGTRPSGPARPVTRSSRPSSGGLFGGGFGGGSSRGGGAGRSISRSSSRSSFGGGGRSSFGGGGMRRGGGGRSRGGGAGRR